MKYVSRKQDNCTEEVNKATVNGALKEIELLSTLEHPLLANLWFSFQGEINNEVFN